MRTTVRAHSGSDRHDSVRAECCDCHRATTSARQVVDRYGSRLLLCPTCYERRTRGQVAI